MWVRRSEEELEHERLASESGRRAVGLPLLAAVVLTVASVGLYSLGIRAWHRGAVVVSAEGVSNPAALVVVAVILFVVSFLLFWRRQRATGQSAFAIQKGTICNQCHESSLEDVGERCSCGGVFEPLAHWEWVDEESDDGSE